MFYIEKVPNVQRALRAGYTGYFVHCGTLIASPIETILITMRNRDSGILYAVLGLYTLMISWYYNHSIVLLVIHWIFWPVYLVYELLVGHLAHDMWKTIPQSYFK